MSDIFGNSTAFDDLLGYLDSVESTVANDFILPDLSQAHELHEEVNNKIEDLETKIKEYEIKEIELKEKYEKNIEILNKDKENIKNRLTKKINNQKSKYDEIISRHQELIDNLIQEKTLLGKECENLTKRVQISREEANRREKEVQEQASAQIAQQRELAIVQERNKFKKTLEQKIKEVKEETVKALQPELETLIIKQKKEIEIIKSEKDDEIKNFKSTFERRAEEERSRLIEQLNKERQIESNTIEQRFQRQLDREKELHKIEIDRLLLKLKQIDDTKIDNIHIAKFENEALLNETRERWKAELASEQLKHSQEITKLKEEMNIKIEKIKEEEKKNYYQNEKKLKIQIENSFKEKNEKKLQIVIKKLEEENYNKQIKIKEETDKKIKEFQIISQNTLNLLEDEKNKFNNQFQLIKNELEDEKLMYLRLEKENERLINDINNNKIIFDRIQNELSQKDIELIRIKQLILIKENEIKENNQIEINNLKKEIEEINNKFEIEKNNWIKEKNHIEEQHQIELESVSKKVKSLIETKDQTISSLKEQLSIAQSRLQEIEQLFHNQKKNILLKIKK